MQPVMSGAVPQKQTIFWLPSVFAMVVTVLLVITSFFYHIKADDIWWHLKAGEFILENLHLPEQNIFSFTAPEHRWLPHEWLSEVFFYLAYSWLGYRGLILLGVLLNALACALVYRLTLRYSGSPFASALITFIAALMMLGNFSLRPYLFGNLFFICALHAMEEPTAGGRLRPALIFVLFAAWANFHGSFLIGLALILLYLAAAVSERLLDRRRWSAGQSLWQAIGAAGRPAALDFASALVACVVTPNHVFGLIFPLLYIKLAFSREVTYLTNISEWQPADLSSPLGQMIVFYLLFCGFAIVGSRKSPRAVHIGLLSAFAFFAFSSIRNIPLLGIAATPIMARHLPPTFSRFWSTALARVGLRERLENWHRATVELNRRSSDWTLPALTALVLALIFALPPSWKISYPVLSGVHRLADLSPDFYPAPLLDELDRLASGKRVFHFFNWGGAIIWGLYPRQRVFIDQRNDCYPPEVFRDYFAVHNLELDWSEVLDRWRIDFVAYPAGSRLSQALAESESWNLVWRDEKNLLFERRPRSAVSGR